jgi:hypothetical protein
MFASNNFAMNYFSSIIDCQEKILNSESLRQDLSEFCITVNKWRRLLQDSGQLFLNKTVLMLKSPEQDQVPLMMALLGEGATLHVASSNMSKREIIAYVNYDILVVAKPKTVSEWIYCRWFAKKDVFYYPNNPPEFQKIVQLPRATLPKQIALCSWFKIGDEVYCYHFSHGALMSLQPEVTAGFLSEVYYFFNRVVKKPEQSRFSSGLLEQVSKRKSEKSDLLLPLQSNPVNQDVAFHWHQVIQSISLFSRRFDF